VIVVVAVASKRREDHTVFELHVADFKRLKELGLDWVVGSAFGLCRGDRGARTK
jgi:hypothetical protein